MFVDIRLLNICVKGFSLGLEIGLKAEAKTLEAEAEIIEAEAGYFGLETEARLRGRGQASRLNIPDIRLDYMTI